MPFDLTEKKIVVAVRDWQPLQSFGFTGPLCYCKVIERDEQGLWVENSDWPLAQPGPAGDETRTVHFLLPWHNIVSIGYFPKERALASSGLIVKVAPPKSA